MINEQRALEPPPIPRSGLVQWQESERSDSCHIRNLLDGRDPDGFADLFPRCLDTVAEQGALAPFERLGGRLLVALDGIQIHCSDTIRCAQCSIRHVGAHKTEQYFHTMLAATVVADGHNRVLPLMPEFVRPQQDPAAQRPELTEEQRKQDCERNAAKRWLPAHSEELRPYRPVFLGDDLYCCQSLCRLVLDLGADFIFVCKPSSHERLHELLHDDFTHSSGWIKTRNRHKQVERHCFRWMHGLPVRDLGSRKTCSFRDECQAFFPVMAGKADECCACPSRLRRRACSAARPRSRAS